MSNFKVGDVCMFKASDVSYTGVNLGKIFTLVKYIGENANLWGKKLWETDTTFVYTDGSIKNLCPEFAMRKLDNPGDDAVDEMVSLVGPAPKIKEVDYAA